MKSTPEPLHIQLHAFGRCVDSDGTGQATRCDCGSGGPTPYVVRSMEARLLAGNAYLQAGQLQHAEEQYRSILDNPPFNAG